MIRWRGLTALLLSLSAVVISCTGAKSASPPHGVPRARTGSAEHPDRSLPDVLHGNKLPDRPSPLVSLRNGKILLDGVVTDDGRAIERAGRLQRVDGLFNAMKATRERWRAAHPGGFSPGIVYFELERDVNALVVKSIFQSARVAGYPIVRFVARARDGALNYLNVLSTDSPFLSKSLTDDGRILLVEARRDGWTLTWRRDREVLSMSRVASSEDLAPRIAKEWASHGSHRNAADGNFDRAVVFASDDVEHDTIVATLDAIAATIRRGNENAGNFRAFEVYLSIAAKPGPEDPLARTNTQLPPEVIQGIVRKNFGRFRACYERGLPKNPKLAGDVLVRFVIGPDGSVWDAREDDGREGMEQFGISLHPSTLPDANVIACVVQEYRKLSFPPPKGTVTVVYPIQFSPGD